MRKYRYLLLAPLLIGGGIAIMLLSYLLVPMLIAGTVLYVLFNVGKVDS